ncbi:sulfotransferase [Nitrogeniibacter mangrovi]|uniref:Sulfotransferase n=1 Tax=Nitrogeniibacter mangrovi TaxID=2016596 RepID=A0A6C1B364_9RHOO|nr:sulfotransferase [Nitrogeniibacter mangrovi]QID16770.1 sulfotransferase [Nitrogeniibacter mangrovi]
MATSNATVVFVTGASRSGTTVLARSLGRHSEILGMDELHYFGELASPPFPQIGRSEAVSRAATIIARSERGIWNSEVLQADRDRAEKIIDGCIGDEGINAADAFFETIKAMAAERGKSIPCEQTPRNIYYAKALVDRSDSVRILHMVRDPHAVLASQKNRWKRRANSNKAIPFSEMIRVWVNYHPYTMAKLWSGANEIAQQLSDHPQIHIVRYEDLVAHPERTLKGICGFLGVAFEEAMLEVAVVGSSQRHDGGRTGFARDSLDAWKHVLTKNEAWVVERTCARLMARFDYPRVADRLPSLGVIGSAARYPIHLLGVLLANPKRALIQIRGLLGLQD